MLYLMRKHAGSWLIKILLGAIVIVFVLWGVGSYRSQKATRVAVVNGEAITLDEYKETYNRLIDQLRQQFGERLNEDMLKLFRVRQQAINQLVDKRVLMSEAERLNFKVSDEELARSIRDIPAFQDNGAFDSRRYEKLLSMNRLSPEDFEMLQRQTLLINKLKTYIEGNVSVSDAEALEWYNWQNASVDMRYVLFEPGTYKGITPTDDEIRSFFDKQKSNYKTEPKVKVGYVAFKPESYNSQVKIDPEDISAYYDANPEEFFTPRKVEARHILFRLDQDAPKEAEEASRLKALDVLKKARDGQDFAELAKQYSEGPTKDRGGYLGAFKKEDMVKPFAERAFSMKAGELSEPVRTRFGWHIIKVEKIHEAATLSFDAVKEKIVRKLTADKARILAYDAAEVLYNASYEGDDLAKIAAAQKLAVKVTDFFTRRGFSGKDIKNTAQFAEAAFKLTSNEISEIQDFDDGYYLLQKAGDIPAKIPPLEDVRDGVLADLIKIRQEDKAKQEAEAFLAAVKNGEPLETLAAKKKLKVNHTGFYKRNDSIPGIGYEQNIIESAFKLSPDHRLPDTVIKTAKGFYTIEFNDRKVPEEQGFDKEKTKIKETLLQQKKLKAFNEWLEKIKSKCEIEIAEEYRE